MSQENEARIVVGLDDSDGGRMALDFALHEALLRGAAVLVVTGWSWTPPEGDLVPTRSLEETRAAASAVQEEAVEAALHRMPEKPVVSQTTVRAPAGEALVAAAEDAQLLVVGSGRKGVTRRWLLGSVSEHCVRHSPAPVVVVPVPHRPSGRRHVEPPVAVGYPMF